MAADGTSIKNDIDNDLANKGYRGIRITTIITTLKKVVDWVTGVINGNQSTWLKTADNQPGGVNSDNVYRTGKVIVGASVDDQSGAVLQAPSASFNTLNGLPAGRFQAITSVAETNLPATRYYPFMELAAPTGGTFDFAHVEMVCKPWDGSAGEPLIIRAYFSNRGGFIYYYTTVGGVISAGLVAVRLTNNRILFYAYADNGFKVISVKVLDMAQAAVYSYFGAPIGAIPSDQTVVFNSTQPAIYPPKMELSRTFSTFPLPNSDGAYPVPLSTVGMAKLFMGANLSSGNSEVSFMNANTVGGGFSWWQQLSATTKRFLGSLDHTGTLLISVLKFPSVVVPKKISLYESANNDHQFYGFGITAGTLKHQVSSVSDRHAFYAGLDPVTSKTLMVIQGDGNTGIGTESPTSRTHIKGSTGYQQLRLETSYTPTGVNDSNGQVGDICWDANYFYVKSSGGWRRTSMTGGW